MPRSLIRAGQLIRPVESVDGVVIPLCVCRLLIRLPRTISRPSSRSTSDRFVNQDYRK